MKYIMNYTKISSEKIENINERKTVEWNTSFRE